MQIIKYSLMANYYKKVFWINKIQNIIRNQGCVYIYLLQVNDSVFSICTLETNLWNLHGHQSVGVHFLLSLFPYRKQQPVITRPNVFSINVEGCLEYGILSKTTTEKCGEKLLSSPAYQLHSEQNGTCCVVLENPDSHLSPRVTSRHVYEHTTFLKTDKRQEVSAFIYTHNCESENCPRETGSSQEGGNSFIRSS